jgi:hypothetical protein
MGQQLYYSIVMALVTGQELLALVATVRIILQVVYLHWRNDKATLRI